jgi:FAD/FMN-containing dehydrogenase
MREIVAGPGTLWKEFDEAAGKFRLATTGGQVSHTGIAGLTLGGGLGYLIGKHGAACDNLLSVEMVTPEGGIITASEETNAELFWAMRGAGANFGVVTAFRYRLHPLPEVLGGMLLYPRTMAAELIAFYREFLVGTPDELITEFLFLNAPDGTPVVAIVAVFSGNPAEGEAVLKPLREFGPPIADLIQPMPYAAVQKILDDAVPTGDRYYWKSNFVDTLSDDLGEVMRQGANAMPSPFSVALLFEIKGAVKRVPKESMAFDHRDASFEMSVISRWMDPGADAANKAWTREVWALAQPYVSQAVYNNHLSDDEGAERVRASYGEAKFAKLAALKAKYDPANLFCSNHNIPPLGS